MPGFATLECPDGTCFADGPEPPDYKYAIINEWLNDLKDSSFEVKFNMDYGCILNTRGKIEGDAALFLAIRHAPIQHNNEIHEWYADYIPPKGYSTPEAIVSQFTNIPIDHARELFWSKDLLNWPGELSHIRARMFVQVLEAYMETGKVLWSHVLPPMPSVSLPSE